MTTVAKKEFDLPLRLVTPPMRGQPVRDAQWLMKGNNRFKGLAPLKDVEIHDKYDLPVGQATKRTKYWLGYPLVACDMVFGQKLYEYLRKEHWRELPKEYQERRAQRIEDAKKLPGDKALDLAITQIGYEEDPFGSNQTKYGKDYGWDRVAWCAIFETWDFKYSGWHKFRYASVEQIVHDARLGRNNMRIVYSPRRGDLCAFNLHGDPYAHTSFFEKWINLKEGSFYDVGGNTGPTDISNGGAVLRQKRYKAMVSNFVRVG